jgi:WD40 repeat protein
MRYFARKSMCIVLICLVAMLSIGTANAGISQDGDQRRQNQKCENGAISTIGGFAFSNDGQYIAAGWYSFGEKATNSAKVWDTKTGKLINTIPHESEMKINKVEFSPDNKYLLTDGGTEADLWSLSDTKRVRVFPHTDENPYGVSPRFLANGKQILTEGYIVGYRYGNQSAYLCWSL